LEEVGKIKKMRNYQKQGKKNEFKINNTKKKEKRAELFKKQLKLLGVISIVAELKGLVSKMERVYAIS
jgi:Tfp pilus assembly protein PilP